MTGAEKVLNRIKRYKEQNGEYPHMCDIEAHLSMIVDEEQLERSRLAGRDLTLEDCQHLIYYGQSKDKTIDLKTGDTGHLDYALKAMFSNADRIGFDGERVERTFWERIKALANLCVDG